MSAPRRRLPEYVGPRAYDVVVHNDVQANVERLTKREALALAEVLRREGYAGVWIRWAG